MTLPYNTCSELPDKLQFVKMTEGDRRGIFPGQLRDTLCGSDKSRQTKPVVNGVFRAVAVKSNKK